MRNTTRHSILLCGMVLLLPTWHGVETGVLRAADAPTNAAGRDPFAAFLSPNPGPVPQRVVPPAPAEPPELLLETIVLKFLDAAQDGAAMTSTEFRNAGVNRQVTAAVTDGNNIFLTVTTEQNVTTALSAAGVPVVNTRHMNTSLLSAPDGEPTGPPDGTEPEPAW